MNKKIHYNYQSDSNAKWHKNAIKSNILQEVIITSVTSQLAAPPDGAI